MAGRGPVFRRADHPARHETELARIDEQRKRLCARVDELGDRMKRHLQWTMALIVGLWGTLVAAMLLQSA